MPLFCAPNDDAQRPVLHYTPIAALDSSDPACSGSFALKDSSYQPRTAEDGLADRLQRFERHYEVIAKPFKWQFTREDLNELVQRLHLQPQPMALAA